MQTNTAPYDATLSQPLNLSFEGGISTDSVLSDPPQGKTVLLLSSKKRIEDAFIRFAIPLEEQGIQMICQGLSGGLGRMQAEFTSAEGTSIWLITPWIFESIEVPFESIDHLIIDTLPFDHPAHTVLSKRSEHYQNPFGEYTLPRLQHRLYRILRTFCRYKTKDADALLLDKRLETKGYGKDVWKYLKQLTEKPETKDSPEDQLVLF